jgi:type I restriction enzyme, R subunit
MHSYRVEKKAAVKIQLPDQDAEIGPVPASGGRQKAGAGPRPFVEYSKNIQRTIR